MLNDKDQELVAIGASIASGCQPCAKYHFRAARIAGADDEEIHQAVIDALDVRHRATEIMARIGGNHFDDAVDSKAGGGESRLLISELVSVSAAFAINCVTNLEIHLASARQRGATDDEILTALKIACVVKDVARNKVQAAAEKLFGKNADHSDECGCREAEHSPGELAQEVTANRCGAERAQSCSCQN